MGGQVDKIPSGWTLCDGTDNTPNLTDRFIVGAGNTYSVGNTGGYAHVTLTTNQMPTHSHTITDPGHDHYVYGGSNESTTRNSHACYANVKMNYLDIETDMSKTNITLNSTGGSASHENRPPYYALCFIMKK